MFIYFLNFNNIYYKLIYNYSILNKTKKNIYFITIQSIYLYYLDNALDILFGKKFLIDDLRSETLTDKIVLPIFK